MLMAWIQMMVGRGTNAKKKTLSAAISALPLGGKICFSGTQTVSSPLASPVDNVEIIGTGSSAQITYSGTGTIFIANAATLPSANAVGGGVLYCDNGALKFRGSSGTITTISLA